MNTISPQASKEKFQKSLSKNCLLQALHQKRVGNNYGENFFSVNNSDSACSFTRRDESVEVTVLLQKLEKCLSTSFLSDELEHHIMVHPEVMSLDEIEAELAQKENFQKSPCTKKHSHNLNSTRSLPIFNAIDRCVTSSPENRRTPTPSSLKNGTAQKVNTKNSNKKKKKNVFATRNRPIIVDGCNVAFQHGKNLRYSAKGLQIVYEYFVDKFGYSDSDITIVNKPGGKKNPGDLEILQNLYERDILVNTPKRYAGTKLIVSDDDLFILNLAKATGGIVVSLDQFRDAFEKTKDPEIKEVIERRILQFVFKGNEVIFPEDPLGSDGPTLKDFLKF